MASLHLSQDGWLVLGGFVLAAVGVVGLILVMRSLSRGDR